MNGPINEGVSSALTRVFSRRSAILKIVEEKALGTRMEYNLVPRARVAFGQYQDTELWKNQFPETKI